MLGGWEKRSLSSTLATMWRDSARIGMWKDTLWGLNPWLGDGFGNYPVSPGKTPSFKFLNYDVHNDYMQAMVDLGIPGLALFTLFFALMVRLGWKNRKEGVALAAGTATVGLAVLQATTFTTQVTTSILWMAGVAAILNAQASVRPLFRRKAPAWRWRLATMGRLCGSWRSPSLSVLRYGVTTSSELPRT